MSLDELRQECYSAVQESNERWKGIPQKLKEVKIAAPPVKQGYPVSVYDESGELVAEYQSIKDAAKYSGITHRIIKEMRNAAITRSDEHIRPRYAVWENVPGAFSSNKGEDFRIVLEEFCKVADKTAYVPKPEKGKWNTCGCIMGDGYSIAWRVLDARFLGVPQRRRRIWLVADFGGERAAEILFERQGLRRSFAESKKAWEETSGNP